MRFEQMRWKGAWDLAAAVLAVAALLAGTGCSLNDGGNALEIDPSSVQVNADTATNVVFTATNGVPPYAWALINYNWGTLVSSGSVATFTTVAVPGQNSIQVKDADGNLARAFVVGIQ
ncbi:MAG: hypothetical protein WCL16_02265 [bacterium]